MTKATPKPKTIPRKQTAKADVKTPSQKKTPKLEKAELPPKDHLKCSFCGKPSDLAYRLIAGPASVCICNECVEVCVKILSEECPYYWHGRLTRILDDIMSSLKDVKLLQPETKTENEPQPEAARKKRTSPSKTKSKDGTNV